MIFEVDLNALALAEIESFLESINNDARINVLDPDVLKKRYTKVKAPTKQKRKKYDWDKIKLKLDIIAAKPENRKQTIKAVASVVGIKNPNGLTHQRIKQIWNEMLKKNAKR